MKVLKKLLAFTLSVAMIQIVYFSAGAFDQSEYIYSVYTLEEESIPFSGEQLSIEAETEEAEYSGNFIKTEDETASSGACLQTKLSGELHMPTPSQEIEEELRYNIKFPEDGIYTFWIRAKTAADQNSYHYRFDGGLYETRWLAVANNWTWYNVASRYLEKGNHSLEFYSRVRGLKIDRLFVSRGSSFQPNGPTGMEESEHFMPGEYYESPSVIPPSEHPRLYARKSDIPSIISHLETLENKPMYEAVLKDAATDTDCVLNLDPNAASNHNNRYLRVIESNAFLYLIDPVNNRKNGEKAIQCFQNYVNSHVCTPKYSYLTRQLGFTILTGAKVYDWCYDLLTQDQKEQFIQVMLSYAGQMEIGWPPVMQSNFNSHAVEDQLMTDLISMAIAIFDERPDIYDLVAGRIFQEVIPAQNFMLDGGSLSEGSNYGPGRVALCLHNQWIFRRMGYPNLYSPEMENAFYSYLMTLKSSGSVISYGDVYTMTPGYSSAASSNLFLAYTYYKNPYFKYVYYKTNPSGLNNGSGNSTITPALHLLLNTEDVEQKNVDDLPLSHVYGKRGEGPNMGLLTRATWKDSGKDDGINVRMNFNQYTMGGHQHLDSGSFTIDYMGSLATDSGLYSSAPWIDENGNTVTSLDYGSDHDINYHKLTIAHNAMLIRGDGEKLVKGFGGEEDDGGQVGSGVANGIFNMADLQKEGVKEGNVLSYDIAPNPQNPVYSYIRGDLTKSYPSSRVENYMRSFVYLNLEEDNSQGALIVYDNMESADPALEKVWLLHSQEEPVIEENKITVQRTEEGKEGRLINETLLPAKPSYTAIGGEGHEFEVNGHNYTAISKQPDYESGKWRVELTNSVQQKKDEFLNVLQIGKKDSEEYQAELIKNDDTFVGVKLKDKVCLISKIPSKIQETVDISVPEADEQLTYIVTGLREGKWKLLKGGKEIESKLVDSEHDTLYFQQPAGSYQLKWSSAEVPVKDLSVKSNIQEKNSSVSAVKINNYFENFQEPLIEQNGTVWLPAEELLQKVEYDFSCSEDGRTITVRPQDTDVILQVSDDSTNISAPQMINGKMYIPIVSVASALKMTAKWYPVSQRLLLTANGKKVSSYLQGIQINGVPLEGFSPDVYDYELNLEADTAEIPEITASAESEKASVYISQPQSLNGQGTVTVRTPAGNTRTYIIKLNYQSPSGESNVIHINPLIQFLDKNGNTLTDLKTGEKITAKYKNVSSHFSAKLILALYENDILKETVSRDFSGITLDDEIHMTVPASVQTENCKVKAFVIDSYQKGNPLIHSAEWNGGNANLASISIDGKLLNHFEPETAEYELNVPASVLKYPHISAVAGDSAAVISVTTPAVFPGTAEIKTVSGNGKEKITRLTFRQEKGQINDAAIKYDATYAINMVEGIQNPVYQPTPAKPLQERDPAHPNPKLNSEYVLSNCINPVYFQSDRTYWLYDIPQELLGSTLIALPFNGLNPTLNPAVTEYTNKTDFVTFRLNRSATVYIAYQSNVNPSWALREGFQTVEGQELKAMQQTEAAGVYPMNFQKMFKKHYNVQEGSEEPVTVSLGSVSNGCYFTIFVKFD